MASSQTFDIIPANQFNVTVSAADLTANPNLYFNSGDVAWMMMSSALVFLMIPGTALFSSGISGRRSALSMVFLPMLTAGVVGCQWWLWGYSIAFSKSGNPFWGGHESFTLHAVSDAKSGNETGPQIPELVYALYQCMFACFTAALVSGSVVKKGRFVPFLVFISIWTTFVYDPIARWTWSPQGWSNKWGNLDFAGGTAVHICAASTAAAYSGFFRIRARLFRGHGFKATSMELQERSHSPAPTRAGDRTADGNKAHSMINVVLGTVLLWAGWFGFNGGSALGANLRAVSACVSTFLAACAGGVTWCWFDWVLITLSRAAMRSDNQQNRNANEEFDSALPGKFSVLGFCNGAIAGLVAITPAAGYVPCRSAPLFGFCAAITCSLFMYKNFISTQLIDTLNIFVIHGVGGWVGMIMTAVFASKKTVALDGYSSIEGGWLDHNWKQLGIQVCDALAGMAYAGGGTLIILFLMEGVTFLVKKRPMENGNEVLDADDIIEKELL